MYESITRTDYVRTDMEYRLDRIRDEIVGRRRRRSLIRREGPESASWSSVR
jgi:hypothetical protein